MKTSVHQIVLFAGMALCFGAMAYAADPPANPLIGTSKGVYEIVKADILGSAEAMPEENFSFQPTPDVRTFAQLLGHVADAQYLFCGAASGAKPESKGIEKSAHSRPELVAALKDAFAYCDGVYAKMTDADAATLVPLFGRQMSKLGVLDLNTAHTFEHYGNMVTYLRLKGVVPPSSQPRK